MRDNRNKIEQKEENNEKDSMIDNNNQIFRQIRERKDASMLSLNETKAGEDYTVKWMTGMPETMDYIRSCKVREGEDVRVISRIFGGVIVGVEDRRILISDDAARRIKVWRNKGQLFLSGFRKKNQRKKLFFIYEQGHLSRLQDVHKNFIVKPDRKC